MACVYSMTVDGIALSAATAKSVWELTTPSGVRAKLASWWCEFDGTNTANTPVKVELARASGAITGTTITPVKYDDFAPTANVTAKHTATVEGTVTDVLEIHRVPPTGGLILQYPLGREVQIPVSGLLRLRVTAAQTVNVTVGTVWEE